MKSPTHLQTEKPAPGDGPMGQSDEMAAAADEFGDEPTKSNLRNPADQIAGGDSDNEPARTQTGAYRLVRPATSDRLDPSVSSLPIPAKTAKKRAIIGVTRRR
jgi:hypothetical protein